MKWITIRELIDLDTGEIISESTFKRKDYYKISSEKKSVENINDIIIVKYETLCKQKGQTKLEL